MGRDQLLFENRVDAPEGDSPAHSTAEWPATREFGRSGSQ